MDCTGIELVPLAVNPETPAVDEAVQAKVVPVTFEVRVTRAEFPPEQIVCVNGELETAGVGLTVIVTVCEVPAQLPVVEVGVTV